MLTFSARNERIRLILTFLSETNGYQATMARMVEFVNGNMMVGSKVNQRTIESDLREIRQSYDIPISVHRSGKASYYVLDRQEYLPLINEEQKEDFGILFQLLRNHSTLRSVTWLKQLLRVEFGVEEKYFQEDVYFVDAVPEMPNEAQMVQLAIQIVQYAKKGEAIQFNYQATTGGKKAKFKSVAPLQVRRYDGRYYLLAMEVLDTSHPVVLATDPTTFVLDGIVGGEVYPAMEEDEGMGETLEESVPITFDHAALARAVDLPHYFDHCIGIVRPRGVSPQLIQLRFTQWACAYVLQHPLHPSQRIKKDGEDLLVTLYVYDTFELDFVLGRFGKECTRIQ